ncbi:DUF4304 domain-containing protein [Pedobacter sp. WC2423]|uniref:DUF4304 domain-containing protein n=1 Tax=Pedobacter sp. WC2423 TaxID=3234142 RepID=UPI003465AAF6
MSSREVFLAACNQINEGLAEFGFKATQKGACLKKISKDLTFEISFQSSTLNSNGYIKLLPHVQITSKRLKNWLKTQTNDVYSNDIVYYDQLGYISHFQEWKSWNVSESNQEKTIAEVVNTIKTYAIPIFNLFEDINEAIQFLITNGTKFNRYTAQSLTPLAFMLCMASKEEAQQFFDNYLINAPGKKLLLNLYKELAAGKTVDLMHAEFVDAFAIKLAFLQGLKIKERP